VEAQVSVQRTDANLGHPGCGVMFQASLPGRGLAARLPGAEALCERRLRASLLLLCVFILGSKSEFVVQGGGGISAGPDIELFGLDNPGFFGGAPEFELGFAQDKVHRAFRARVEA